MIRARGDLRAGPAPAACEDVRAARVLVLSARSGDALLGCGGLLARLARDGSRIEVLLLTGGDEREGAAGDERSPAEASRASREALGLAATHAIDLPLEALERDPGLARSAIAARLDDLRPDLVLAPSPLSEGAGRASAFAALHGLLSEERGADSVPPGLRVLLYEVDRPQHPDLLVDVSAEVPLLAAELERREDGHAPADDPAAALGLRRSRALDLPPGVTHVEAYRRLEAADFVLHSPAQLVERLGGEPRLAPAEDGPLVSVVVRTRNRPAFLAEALASLAAGTYRNVEVVLVNDGGVPPVVPAEYPFPVRRVDRAEREGRAAAAQAGLDAASGEYVGFLDDDDVAAPEHLATLVGLARSTRARVVYTDAAVTVFEPAPPGEWRCVERRLPYSRDFDAAWLAVDNYIPFNTVLVERALLLETGGMDLRLERMEDWDLLVRLSQRAPFRHLSRVTCEYRHFRGAEDHALGADAATPDELSAARARVLEKHLPGLDAATLARGVTHLREEAVRASERVAELERLGLQRDDREREARARHEELSAELRRVYGEEARLTAILGEWQQLARSGARGPGDRPEGLFAFFRAAMRRALRRLFRRGSPPAGTAGSPPSA